MAGSAEVLEVLGRVGETSPMTLVAELHALGADEIEARRIVIEMLDEGSLVWVGNHLRTRNS